MRTETEAPGRGPKRRRQADLAAKGALRLLLPARRLVLGIAVALLAGLAGVATGAAGAVAAAVWPPGVTIDPHTYMSQGPVGLSDVSCPTKRFCAALDAAGYVLASTDPAGGAAAWRQVESGANFMPESISGEISCASRRLCVVVDQSGHVYTSKDPFGGPRTWHRIRLGSALGDVSCPSARFCAATGNGAVLTSTDPAGGARAWRATKIPHDNLYFVSCPSSRLCFGAGYRGEIASSTNPRDARSWKVIHVRNHGHNFVALSCPTRRLCVGVDDGGNAVSSTHPTGGPRAWRVAHIETVYPDSNGPFQDVSCTRGGLCVAVGNNDLVSSTNPTGGAGTWTHTRGDINYPFVEPHTVGLNAVSCASSHLCVAVDSLGTAIVSTDPASAARHR